MSFPNQSHPITCRFQVVHHTFSPFIGRGMVGISTRYNRPYAFIQIMARGRTHRSGLVTSGKTDTLGRKPVDIWRSRVLTAINANIEIRTVICPESTRLGLGEDPHADSVAIAPASVRI